MDNKLIYGIQQIGVGVDDAREAFEWYATRLGSDIEIFEDNNEATYMAPYMGGEARKKRAILAMNMQGGSGFEIWQHTGRTPERAKEEILLGDLGINIATSKSRNIQKSFDRLKAMNVKVLSEINEEPDGKRSFFIEDPCANILKIKECDIWYAKKGFDIGGPFGCLLGVSNIDQSLKLYSDILGYDHVAYDKTGTFDDLQALPGGKGEFRRVLLTPSEHRTGGFANLFGQSQLELIQCLDRTPNKIFKDRFWGDIGFIHLCFDINNMKVLVEECKEAGFPFTVLSGESFDMGDANGHWGYLEDPDNTLIEFVETHKVPLIKAINFNINLRGRDPVKPLPNWLMKSMSFKRKKFN
jgi:catechol 2,3-dioxygenase-like lactoylglutathione lyase family enzyme